MTFDSDDAMQKKWKAFIRKIDTKTDDYSTVLKAIKDFLSMPFSVAIHGNDFDKRWYAAECRCKDEV